MPCAVYGCVRQLKLAGCHECTESECLVGDIEALECPLRERFGGSPARDEIQRMLSMARGASARPRTGIDVSRRRAERLRSYFQVVEDYAGQDVATISSHQLASAGGVRSSLVRRDLSSLGSFGTPGRGYAVAPLGDALRSALKLERAWPTVWLGDAALSSAETTRRALDEMGCELVGIFDNESAGTPMGGIEVQELDRAPEEVRRRDARVAVLASEGVLRPDLVQELGAAGVIAVLNLTPRRLREPAQVAVEQADLGSQLFRLLSRVQDKEDGGKGSREHD
jgi:redox-sensing transcriptional repressor